MPPPWAATAQPLVSRSARRAVDECASSVICRSLLCSAADHAAGRNGRPRAASHQAQCAASPVSGELLRRRTEPPGPAYSARRQEPKVDPAVLVLAQRTAADPRQLAGLAITVSCAFRNRFQSMRSLVSGTRDGHRGHLDPQAAGCTVQRTRRPAPAPRRRPRPGSGRRQRRPPPRAPQAGEPQELRPRSKPAAWSLSAHHSPVSGEVPLPHSGYVHHRRRSQPEAADRRTHPTCALGRGGMAPPGRLAAGARVPASGRELVGMTRGR
jgi:hypothetical protein